MKVLYILKDFRAVNSLIVAIVVHEFLKKCAWEGSVCLVYVWVWICSLGPLVGIPHFKCVQIKACVICKS